MFDLSVSDWKKEDNDKTARDDDGDTSREDGGACTDDGGAAANDDDDPSAIEGRQVQLQDTQKKGGPRLLFPHFFFATFFPCP